MERRKKIAMQKIIKPVPENELDIDINQIYPEDKGIIGEAGHALYNVKVILVCIC